MNDGVNIIVEASSITDSQLVSHHIAQYMQTTGFNDVTVSQADPLQFPEPSSQSEALQAIRRLNPALFDMPVTIEPSVYGSSGALEMPDGPSDED